MVLRLSRHGSREVLLVTTELVWPEGLAATLQEIFGLTPAEVEVVQGITLGLPTREIAASRARSLETVRTQIRTILTKTETHSQIELLRVVYGLMELVGASRPGGGDSGGASTDAGGFSDGAQPLFRMQLHDGRQMTWLEFGAPTGHPVLFMHGGYGLVHWPEAAARTAAVRSLRVIVPLRAGFGGSDPLPSAANHLVQSCEDYAAVLDHLGLEKAVVLPLGADLRFAMKLTQIRPDLVRAILGCGCQLPFACAPGAGSGSGPSLMQRFLQEASRHPPEILTGVSRLGLAFAGAIGAEALLLRLFGGNVADRLALSQPPVMEALRRGIAVSRGRHLAEALARDWREQMRDWRADVAPPAVPVHLLQGEADESAPLSLLRGLERSFPGLRVHALPMVGQLLFHAAWPTILSRVSRLMDRN